LLPSCRNVFGIFGGQISEKNDQSNKPMKTPIRFLFTLLCAAAFSLPSVHAANTYTVQDTGDGAANAANCPGSGCRLRDALAKVIDGDMIEFLVTTPATITLTNGQLEVGKSITISGPGADQLSVNGNAASSVFQIDSGKTVTISGLTITNGSAFSAGGIYNDHATLTVTNSTLSGNLAPGFRFLGGFGGGIYNDGSSGSAALTVNNSTLSGNSATTLGGGIFNDGSSSGNATLTVTNSTLSGNSASSGDGGGIYNYGFDGNVTLTVTNSTLSGNSATNGDGGGIYNDGDSDGTPSNATLTVTDSTLSGNSASSGDGGGIYNYGFDGNVTLTVTNSTLSGNSAGGDGGGGIYNDGESDGAPSSATLTITNSTLSANSASNGGGGGILNDGGFGSATLTVSNSTLSGNSASVGGGIDNYGELGSAPLTVFNSTLSGNSSSNHVGGGILNDSGRAGGNATLTIGDTILNAAASGGANIVGGSGTVTSNGYNLSSDDGGGFLTVTGDQINTDPKLGPLQDNGGPTFTHALLTGSPAIDQGYNFSDSTTDQRGTGFARTVDLGFPKPTGGDGTDIGSFEVQSSAPCPQPQGYWKNNPSAWPASALPMTLGTQTYNQEELLTILGTPTGKKTKADASLILADQLIAAKLNIANGADGTPVTSTIADADAVLSLYTGKLPYRVRTNSTNGQRMVNDANVLNNYNNGALTSGCAP
jgi:hypothetical protein